MLDSYIIKRIQEEQDRARQGRYQPLRIERLPPEPSRRPPTRKKEPSRRGSVVVDYKL
jgi:hypothetical protein